MLPNVDYRKWLLSALVIAHIAWIVNHLRLVANDEVNPWRLGGYGMYTVPAPNVGFRVFDEADPNLPLLVNKQGFERTQRFINPNRIFRCAPMAAEALRSFLNENRKLIGRNIVIIFSELRFHRTPPSVSRETQGRVLVTWPDMNTFTFTSKFCGAESTESANLDE